MSEWDSLAKQIGRRIYSQRKKLGLTQEQVAELADVSPQFLSNMENGKRNVSALNLFKISRALKVSADYLLTGDVTDLDRDIILGKLKDASPSDIAALEEIYEIIKKM